MRISDWSSDVCSSDLEHGDVVVEGPLGRVEGRAEGRPPAGGVGVDAGPERRDEHAKGREQPDEADDEDRAPDEIGRASGRERVGQYVYIWVGGGSLKKKSRNKQNISKHMKAKQ